MEKVKEAIARHGTTWTTDTNAEMTTLYESLHAAQKTVSDDTVTVQKKIPYGSHDRQRLDIYRPASVDTRDRLPVVIFFHGGGFVSGDTDVSSHLYSNIGNFFASNMCLCMLATYRLLPEARFPSGAEDIHAALRWVHDHAVDHGGDSASVVAVGQSAGGAHLAASLWGARSMGVDAPESEQRHQFKQENGVGSLVSGVILLSAPLWYDMALERRRTSMLMYHATNDVGTVLGSTGLALFERHENQMRTFNTLGVQPKEARDPNLLIMVAEFDSNEIVQGNLAFVQSYHRIRGLMPSFEVMKGHNHISNVLAIGLLDQGQLGTDVLGSRILEFITQISPD